MRRVAPSPLPANNPFEAGNEEEEVEEGFVDPELPYRGTEDGSTDSFNVFPSRADEALKTCKHTKKRFHLHY